MQELVIGQGLTAIGDYVFQVCGLTAVRIPDNVTSIGIGAFRGCQNLADLSIGNGVTEIGIEAFMDCYDLVSIEIPNNVKTIGKNAFFGCNELRSLTLGNGVEMIDEVAFNSNSLRNVYCLAEIPPAATVSSFAVFYAEVTLHVPESTLDLYKSVAPWNKFFAVVPIDETDIKNISFDESKILDVYSLGGGKLRHPQKGVNIIRQSDGTTRKVIVR